MMMTPRQAGMGDWGCIGSPDYRINSAGSTIDCACANNLTEGVCWGFGGPSTLPQGTTPGGPPPPVNPNSGLSLGVVTPWLIIGAIGVTALVFLRK